MSEETLHDDDGLDALAAELGLERMLALDREAFVAAVRAARGFAERTRRPGRIDAEPAHVCLFVPPARATER